MISFICIKAFKLFSCDTFIFKALNSHYILATYVFFHLPYTPSSFLPQETLFFVCGVSSDHHIFLELAPSQSQHLSLRIISLLTQQAPCYSQTQDLFFSLQYFLQSRAVLLLLPVCVCDCVRLVGLASVCLLFSGVNSRHSINSYLLNKLMSKKQTNEVLKYENH